MACEGQIIGGKYKIVKLLDEGGTSRVYLAQKEQTQEQYAVKEVSCSYSLEDAVKEADIISRLDHPFIVKIFDIFRERDTVYIIEEFIDGISVGQLKRSGEGIDQERILRLSVEVCQVLVYLHSQDPKIIYRDIKPDNILISKDHIKVIDFGIAREYKPGKAQDTRNLGTVHFAAPEQYEDQQSQTDERTDIYGFGRTFLYLSESCENISDEFLRILNKCARFSPSDRYSDALEVLRELENCKSVPDKNSFKQSAMPFKKTPEKVVVKTAIVSAAAFCALAGLLFLSGMNKEPAVTDMVSEIQNASAGRGLFIHINGFIHDYMETDMETDTDEILDCIELSVNIIGSNAYAFKEGGVDYEELNTLLDEMYQKTEEIYGLKEKEGDMDRTLPLRIEEAVIETRKIYE